MFVDRCFCLVVSALFVCLVRFVFVVMFVFVLIRFRVSNCGFTLEVMGSLVCT